MNKTERKRQTLESLYMQYRAGKTCLNDVLRSSLEMDTLINEYYAGKGKMKRPRCKTTG